MLRPADSRELSDDTGSVAAQAGNRIFVWAWIGVVLFGLEAYLQGFSPSLVLCLVMIIPGIVWVAAFFAAIDVPIRRIASLSLQQYLFLLCILVSTGPASGYAFGWLYTATFGLRSQPILQVAEKHITYRRGNNYTIRLKIDEVVPTYYMTDKHLWDHLEIGAPVRVSAAVSVLGSVINNFSKGD